MVSSSPMKVAQFPSEEHHKDGICAMDLSKGKAPSPPAIANGYAGLSKADNESKPGINGFTPSSDGYSEPSTNDSMEGSPESSEDHTTKFSREDKFVDAPQATPDVANLNAHGVSPRDHADATYSRATTPVLRTPNGDRSSNPHNEPVMDGEAPPKQLSASTEVPATDEQQDAPSASMAREPAEDRQDPGKEAPRTPPGSPTKVKTPSASSSPARNRDYDKLRARTQSTGQKSQAPSTTSKRAAAVAAAELEDDVLVGTRVSEGHENFVTAYNMSTGIRVAVSRCTAKNNRSSTDADFSATDEISFHMNGGGHSPSSRYMFHFKDYAPWVFRHLRDAFGLDPADYLMSSTAKYIVSEMGSPGKSGSYFYYSRDFRFIIKTIRHSEHKSSRHVSRQYYSHVKANPDTSISQIYGSHRVKVSPGRKIHFLVMNNVFPALYQIHERFDSKGSSLGREYHPDPRKRIVVYKDLDWSRQHQRIVSGKEKRERLVRQLEIDTQFSERINVMDYSLLVGIHDRSKGNAASDASLKFAQFGPQDERQSQGEKRAASAAVRGTAADHHSPTRNQAAEKEFAASQMSLQRATPERSKEFDFADEYRSHSYFYKEHGGFLATDENNNESGVIYYIGVIDFSTGYTFRKSVETFCKSLIHDRRELSAVPAKEYGDRFSKFLRGSIGPAIPSSRPQKRTTDQSQSATKTGTDSNAQQQDHDNKQGNTVSQAREANSKDTDRATDQSTARSSSRAPTSISSPGTPPPPSPQTPPAKSSNSDLKQEGLPKLVTTPVNGTHPTTPNKSPRGSPGKAITSDVTGNETAAASPLAGSPDSSNRRPSVVGYGLNSSIEA